MTQLGVNFLRNRAYAEWCQYDAWNVANNTTYGQWLIATYGNDKIYGADHEEYDEIEQVYYTAHTTGLMETSAGYNNSWLLGNSYTDWALDKLASIGVKWIRDWAVVGQWPRLVASAPKTGGVVSGPIVFDGNYDWSVLDRTVEKTSLLGLKLVLTLPQPYPQLVDQFGWSMGVADVYGGDNARMNDNVLNYLLAPYAAQLAARYQDYTHIYIDPLNELSIGQTGSFCVNFQRTIYNAVKNALPVGKKDNIKVQMVSQFYQKIGAETESDALTLINAIGSEHIYDEYVAIHYYPNWGASNNFSLSDLPAIRAALNGYGRTDVKIKFDEYGAWDVATIADSVAAIPNMTNAAVASGLVDATIYWPCVHALYPPSNGYNGYSTIGLWRYASFNQSALPNPFPYLEDFTALAAAVQSIPPPPPHHLAKPGNLHFAKGGNLKLR